MIRAILLWSASRITEVLQLPTLSQMTLGGAPTKDTKIDEIRVLCDEGEPLSGCILAHVLRLGLDESPDTELRDVPGKAEFKGATSL